MEKVLVSVFNETALSQFSYRRLYLQDLNLLYELIHNQKPADLEYFHPHGFDLASIRDQFATSSFLMMGVFSGDKLVGYFFLRFFANKKCFVGRLIDKDYRGQGIGPVMNKIMYGTAWGMGFRCLSTISRSNSSVIRAHANNPNMIVLKELQDNFLLVEFVRVAK